MSVEIFFGTNRNVKKRDPNQQPVDFGEEINDSKPLLHFGKAKVSDNYDEVEEVRTSPDTFSEELCCNQDIFNEIQDRMYRGIDTILFFHGFSNTFNDSLKGAAELKRLYEQKSNNEHIMMVLSWPSKGSYKSGQEKAQESDEVLGAGIYQLSQFLKTLCWLKLNKKPVSNIGKNENSEGQNGRPGCGRVHIMAHSMGTYILRHILQELREITNGGIVQLFDEVLLIAADEDEDAFEHEDKLKFLPEFARHVTIYFNPEDKALEMSEWLNDEKRLGLDGPSDPSHLPANVFSINCRDVVSGGLEHDYYKVESAVSHDIAYVLSSHDPKNIPGRDCSPETNTYCLIDLTDHPDLPLS